ncbi:MAG: sugar phosphate isomerase/epimerase [Oscillospiraceae bacterium]|nr:sugar phosphate isomerase/epimerase [Oscillospiraceae bacterium]
MAKKMGLQVYSIRDIYFKDPAEAFKLIKDSGYDAVDMFGSVNMPAETLKKLLGDAGLECCGWHAGWDYLSKPDILEMFASYNKIIGNKYLICPGLPFAWQEKTSKDQWLEAAGKLNEIAAQLKQYGMFTGIHSHSVEFKPTEGTDELPWDILAKNTVNDVVLQLDMGNTYAAGTEPVAVLKKYPGRYRTIHIKPYSLTKGMNVVIGEDDIDWTETVKFCNEQGNTEYFIVEYEESDAKTGIKTCADNFKKYL